MSAVGPSASYFDRVPVGRKEPMINKVTAFALAIIASIASFLTLPLNAAALCAFGSILLAARVSFPSSAPPADDRRARSVQEEYKEGEGEPRSERFVPFQRQASSSRRVMQFGRQRGGPKPWPPAPRQMPQPPAEQPDQAGVGRGHTKQPQTTVAAAARAGGSEDYSPRKKKKPSSPPRQNGAPSGMVMQFGRQSDSPPPSAPRQMQQPSARQLDRSIVDRGHTETP